MYFENEVKYVYIIYDKIYNTKKKADVAHSK